MKVTGTTRSIMPKGVANDTSSSSYGITGSFPHYKQIKMPPDQQAKLQAMHDASRANAGIYVAVVLAVYIILLTMLLCRYSRRQRSSSGDGPSTSQAHHHSYCHTHRPSSNNASSTWYRKFSPCRELLLCCGYPSTTDDSHEDGLQEITEYPLTTLAPLQQHRKSSATSNNGVSSDRPISV